MKKEFSFHLKGFSCYWISELGRFGIFYQGKFAGATFKTFEDNDCFYNQQEARQSILDFYKRKAS